MRHLNRLVIVALALTLLVGAPTFAAGKDELSISGSLTNPNDGGSSWTASGDYLVSLGETFLVGPSFSLFDSPGADGGAIGLASELNLGKTSGLFVRAALHKLTGDLGDLAKYDGEAGAGVKLGTGTGAFKLYARRTWTRGETGEITAPDSTDVLAGLIIRVGK